MTGRRNRIHTPCGSSPRAPLLRLALLWIKKIGYREFQTSSNSHEIQCEHHLVAVLFVCGNFLLAGDAGLPGRRGRRPLRRCGKSLLKKRFILRVLDFKAAPAKECRGSGERNTDLSRRESRYLDCEARQIYGCFEMVLSPEAKQNIFMAALRWFLPRENSCIIERTMEFKAPVLLFVICLRKILTYESKQTTGQKIIF